MKILHLCLGCFYIDNYSYQENLLPKYHKLLGYEVKIIASLMSFDSNGVRCYLPNASEYKNEHGIDVKRLDFKQGKIGKLLRRYRDTYKSIDEFAPDIIFIHGVQFADIDQVVKYIKKHPKVKVYIDNHSDFSNSAKGWFSLNIQHKLLWKYYAQMINPYVSKWYGVLPARVDFLIDLYKIPKEKVELLVMGADDEFVKKYSDPTVREQTRREYGIEEDDFVIVNGGKVDQWKKQTLLLMDAVNKIDNPRVKLLMFGSIVPEMKEEVLKRCSDRVQYIGWANTEQSYKYYAAGDVACFPGRHSVYWEQVAGQGIPMICKYWDGTTHTDFGGNTAYLHNDDVVEIEETIQNALITRCEMKRKAIVVQDNFLYSFIAERCIK